MSRQNVNQRTLNIDFNRDETSNYSLLVAPGALTDIYGNINDTVKFSFSITSSDYYSSIILNLVDVPCEHSIVQLLNLKEKVLEERTLNGDTKLSFNYLKPDSYILKIICDDNQNGKWDTGNFNLRLQPERVYYYDQTIETKSGWDMEFTWKIE